MTTRPRPQYRSPLEGNDAISLVRDIRRHMTSTLGADWSQASALRVYQGLAHTMRDRLIDQWIQTQRAYYDKKAKRVYYLSMEFLPGRFLMHNIHNLGLVDECRRAVEEFGYSLEDICEQEWDPGLGNGGLGRLASCYVDSMASLRVPGYGYGIRYDYGIFTQKIIDGQQVEQPDHWMRFGNPWEYQRTDYMFQISFGGRVVQRLVDGRLRVEWVDADHVMAMACDLVVPGYNNSNAINMRLWSARSSRELNLADFNRGNYVSAIEDKIRSENISKVLYPSEQVLVGRELRLKQEYFFVAATIQDILRRVRKKDRDLRRLPDFVAIQLNDTHPAIAVPELMRVLVDQEHMEWEDAWRACVDTFGYTNHTVLPEALETWPLEMMASLLPRHVQIIDEINRRFLIDIEKRHPGDWERRERMAVVTASGERRVRMAHLAVVGSHKVNGVSALHSRILEGEVMRELSEMFPGRFTNVTNGVNHRRFLAMANPPLAALITSIVGNGWYRDAMQLKGLEKHVDDPAFRAQWMAARVDAKERTAAWIKDYCEAVVDPAMLFDVQVKRFHEYKRQLLPILHAIVLYQRIKAGKTKDFVPRSVMIGGKSAPGYAMAKLIIRLACNVSDVVRADKTAHGLLTPVFIPNYGVSVAERLLPATDLSEQVSTAGLEASGTGNMKFALNGALIIGTLDGANIEIMEQIGRENIFIFGNEAAQVRELRLKGYDPRAVVAGNAELKAALDAIADGMFSGGDRAMFAPLLSALLDQGDHFQVMADFRSFLDCQAEVEKTWRMPDEWARKSILSVARMGMFSSDRAVGEYARNIWGVEPLERH